MIDKILGFFDEEHEYNDVWELKLIKFDIDLDDEVKPYERYLAISHIVEDTKGNAGLRGHFYVTNLRFIWHASNDRDTNLSIGSIYKLFRGLDTINNAVIKQSIVGGGATKNMLVVKTQSPNGSKYEFKFSIFNPKEVGVFEEAVQIYKQVVATKPVRNIELNVPSDPSTKEYIPLPEQEIYNTYEDCKLYENERSFEVTVTLSNLRVSIIQKPSQRESKINYGIPWIMIESFEKTTYLDQNVIELKARGSLRHKQLYIRPIKSFSKFSSEFQSLCDTFAKNPILGLKFDKIADPKLEAGKMLGGEQNDDQFEETFETTVKVKRAVNPYGSNSSQGILSNTFFNEQLGIMMEKLPKGETRSSLWQILS